MKILAKFFWIIHCKSAYHYFISNRSEIYHPSNNSNIMYSLCYMVFFLFIKCLHTYIVYYDSTNFEICKFIEHCFLFRMAAHYLSLVLLKEAVVLLVCLKTGMPYEEANKKCTSTERPVIQRSLVWTKT